MWPSTVATRFRIPRPNMVKGPHGCGFWKSIMNIRPKFWELISIDVTSGLDTRGFGRILGMVFLLSRISLVGSSLLLVSLVLWTVWLLTTMITWVEGISVLD